MKYDKRNTNFRLSIRSNETVEKLLEIAKEAALAGGSEILRVYNNPIPFEIETKEDDSPLTVADKNAHNAIIKFLESTRIPVLSEEGRDIPFEERKSWSRLWIVDPLDGTKEFIKRNGEFTVNIALIENNLPILGVIYVPVQDVLYYGGRGVGSFKIERGDSFQLPRTVDKTKYVAVGSRSHKSKETEAYFKELERQHGKIEVVSMGSSLKICLVAEGIADVYPRFAPTMEWDTAAGHAIAKYAGKSFVDYTTQKEMNYNRDSLLNNWFLVF